MLNTDARDPAALPRLLLALLAWRCCGRAAVERTDPGVLLQADNRQQMASFVAGFWPPAHDREFLGLLWQATLQTLAVATAGMALALLLAMPASLLASRALSLRRPGGRAGGWSRTLRCRCGGC
jgi:phosphonate transport system permease protein